MCRELKKLGLTQKKDATKQSIGDRNGAKIKKKILKKFKTIHPENLVFIDSMGFLLIDYKLCYLASWYQSIRYKTILGSA
ncbi:hypothetical protein C7B67_11265 [filamentous cyanobacterium Phorm 6]|nr:hypothetical protein C7B67_11265 [filamentous cyanobacterium Phorm 6]